MGQNFCISINRNEADQVINTKPVRASRPGRKRRLPLAATSPNPTVVKEFLNMSKLANLVVESILQEQTN
jgi:hypothetical protein